MYLFIFLLFSKQARTFFVCSFHYIFCLLKHKYLNKRKKIQNVQQLNKKTFADNLSKSLVKVSDILHVLKAPEDRESLIHAGGCAHTRRFCQDNTTRSDSFLSNNAVLLPYHMSCKETRLWQLL